MKKKIFLHIGTHKTGTTSLQSFMDFNRNSLHEQGILYPKTGWYHHSQHMLAFQLKNILPPGMPDYDENIWNDLRNEIDSFSGSRVLISSEEFSTITSKEVSTLKEELKNYDVEIIIYLRRQDELFESMFNQQTKDWRSPRKAPISFFLKEPENIYQFLNYENLLAPWIENFNLDHVHIRLYDKNCMPELDTVKDFIVFLRLDADKLNFAQNKKLNISVGAKALEAIRLSKNLDIDEIDRKNLFDIVINLFTKKSQESLLSSKERKSILDKYDESNNNIYKLIKNQCENTMFSQVSDDLLKSDDLTRGDVMEIVLVLLKRIRKEEDKKIANKEEV